MPATAIFIALEPNDAAVCLRTTERGQENREYEKYR